MATPRDQGPTLDYITRTFVAEPEWTAAARTEGERRRPGMQVSSYEGHLLRWIVQIAAAKRVLEIGTFMATSTLWMADGLAEGGRITALEFDADYAAQARQHIAASPDASRIEIIEGDAHGWIRSQPMTQTYDLVLIDAEKSGYAHYLEEVLPLVKPRGFIVGANTLLFGAMSGESPAVVSMSARMAMTKFNETLADPSRFETILLPTPEGMTVARLK